MTNKTTFFKMDDTSLEQTFASALAETCAATDDSVDSTMEYFTTVAGAIFARDQDLCTRCANKIDDIEKEFEVECRSLPARIGAWKSILQEKSRVYVGC